MKPRKTIVFDFDGVIHTGLDTSDIKMVASMVKLMILF